MAIDMGRFTYAGILAQIRAYGKQEGVENE
jgi:hypothetical protein